MKINDSYPASATAAIQAEIPSVLPASLGLCPALPFVFLHSQRWGISPGTRNSQILSWVGLECLKRGCSMGWATVCALLFEYGQSRGFCAHP